MGRPMIWLRSAPVAGASSRITSRSWRVHSKTSAAHAHEHIFLGEAHDAHERRTRWVVELTAGITVVEIIAGWHTGTVALRDGAFGKASLREGACQCGYNQVCAEPFKKKDKNK